MARRKETVDDIKKRLASGDASDRLILATWEWVEANGGTVVVSGGIRVVRWPEDGKYTFSVDVRCTGKAPERKS
jgi:hypothetical protein